MHVFLRSAMILRPNSWGLFRQLVDIGGALALPFQPTAVFLGTAEAKRKEQPVHKPGQAAQCQAALFKGADRTGGKIYSPQRKERRKRQCACINELPFSKYHQLCFFSKTANPCEKISRPYELVNTSWSSTTRQAERAAKTARSEGPPVKKQPVPAEVPWSSRAGRKYDDSGGVNGDLTGYISNNLERCRYAIC